MTPTATCPICGRKYAGWAIVTQNKCCGKVLEVKRG